MNRKHHYREASKSDHLAKEDVLALGGRVDLHIDHCEWFDNRKISGTNKPKCIVAFFSDKNIKPWVINQTNCKVIASVFGEESKVEDWVNFSMMFYVDHTVQMMKKVVGGIKIAPIEEPKELPLLTKAHEQWPMAVGKAKDGMSIEEMNSFFIVTPEIYKELLNG